MASAGDVVGGEGFPRVARRQPTSQPHHNRKDERQAVETFDERNVVIGGAAEMQALNLDAEEENARPIRRSASTIVIVRQLPSAEPPVEYSTIGQRRIGLEARPCPPFIAANCRIVPVGFERYRNAKRTLKPARYPARIGPKAIAPLTVR